jgi:integrase
MATRTSNASTFRASVLQPAFRAAGVEGGTMYGLRHADAPWLLVGDADLQVVKERLGHAKISTTEGYLNPRVLYQPGEKPQVTWSVPLAGIAVTVAVRA